MVVDHYFPWSACQKQATCIDSFSPEELLNINNPACQTRSSKTPVINLGNVKTTLTYESIRSFSFPSPSTDANVVIKVG